MQLHRSYRNERIASDGNGHQQFQASIDRFRIRQTALDTSVLLKAGHRMTSEILILNKRAAVIGADSAMTSSWGGDHPRFSKSANKIFELTRQGSIAVAIYGSASIDSVPWELAIKLFRAHLGARTFGRASDYATAILSFLTANNQLFPPSVRNDSTGRQFDAAIEEIVRMTRRADDSIFDRDAPIDRRRAAWTSQTKQIRELLDATGVVEPLSAQALNQVLRDLAPWTLRAEHQISKVASLAAVNAAELAELGHRLRYAAPQSLIPGSGLVIVGYGEEQIFPAYTQLEVFGHVGDELLHGTTGAFEVTHGGAARIQPLASTSMIDAFIDGYDRTLEAAVDDQSKLGFESVFQCLHESGIDVPRDLAGAIAGVCQQRFMVDWKRMNWQHNCSPLLRVLQSLDVPEMADLVEALLGIESLKERVTSSSESVGGPIDVAAITKEEGLVWIRRKHYFDAAMNTRYVSRLHKSFD
ncbi:hypothetical protein [Roseateles chitinivorans]|uniref:hypothetical protein n=1 Tax=Roseateles chitinivorans TaxID=2917965 RepID=UPI003D670B62